MKTFAPLFVLSLLVLLSAACNRQEPVTPVTEAPTLTAPSASNAAAQATTGTVGTLDQTAADVQAQADNARQTLDRAAADAQEKTAAVAGDVESKIESARRYLAEKNWSEAMKELNALASRQLTPEQRAKVDSLKQEAQKLAQDVATSKPVEEGKKAIDNLLK